MRTIFSTIAISAILSASAFAQLDLSGSWAARNFEDTIDKAPGAQLVDYTGLPLNATGRLKALSDSALLSEPERVCLFYPPFYLAYGPQGIKIWSDTDPDTGEVIDWKLSAVEDRPQMTIWMDGRPHPSKYAPHEKSGFSTGVWEGDVLTVTTTHIKAGYIRRNGAPSSDQGTVTMHFLRHGDLMTITTLLDDPIYLDEPMYWSKTVQLDYVPVSPVAPPCIRDVEGPKEGVVPHYLPGKNPFINELTEMYGLPTAAILGGGKTIYPEFRKEIKDKYVRPAKCLTNCGGPAGGAAPPPPRPAAPPR